MKRYVLVTLAILAAVWAVAAKKPKPTPIAMPEAVMASLPGCCIGDAGACVPRVPIFPGGCPEGWAIVVDPALCPVPCGAPAPTPTPTPTPPASLTFTALPGAGAAWSNYVESGGWLRLSDGSWLVTGETGWLAWPLPPDKPGETLCGVHYPTAGSPRRIEYARATDAVRPGDRGHEAGYLKMRRIAGQWVGLYAATWESSIGNPPRVGAGLARLGNGPLQPATEILHDWHRPPTGVFPAGLVEVSGQWWLYGWDIGVQGQGLARWPVSADLSVGAKQVCSAGPFDAADVAVEGGTVVLWKGDPASSTPVIASATGMAGRWRDWFPAPPPELAWVQAVSNPRVRRWTAGDGCTFAPSAVTRATDGYTSWAPAALTDETGAVQHGEAVLVTQSPGGVGGSSGQWRLAAWHGVAPATWGQPPLDPAPTPTPTPTPQPVSTTASWQHMFAGAPGTWSQVLVVVACSPSCTLAWGEEPRTVSGQITLRRDYQGRPPDILITGGIQRVTVAQSPGGTADSGMAVTVWP